MPRRQLLTDEERQELLGVPPDAESLARLLLLSRSDRSLVAERRGDANRLGYAVQLALLRHPGTAFAYLDQLPDALVSWMAGQLEMRVTAFAEYARSLQAMTDHGRQLAATSGLCAPTMTDLSPMIEAAEGAARGTDRGQPVAAAVMAARRHPAPRSIPMAALEARSLLAPACSGILNRYRNLVGRFFNRLKRVRAVATRCDKREDTFFASVQLASIRILRRHHESVTYQAV